jgi:methionyl-tRNA formyltransferase
MVCSLTEIALASDPVPLSIDSPVRVIYCTSGGLYGALVLDKLLASPRIEVVGVTLSTRILRKQFGWFRGSLTQLKLTGLRYALYLWCATDLADLLAAIAPIPSVRSQLKQNAIPVLYTRDINNAAGVEFLTNLQPDLLLSGFFNQRLTSDVFTVPLLGSFNIHPGALPDFRGVDPVFRAMERGKNTLAVTLHRVVETFDSGPVLAVNCLSNSNADSLMSLTARLFCLGTDLLIENLSNIVQGGRGEEQNGPGQYDSWPTPESVRGFVARGKRLVQLKDLWRIRRGMTCSWVE